MGAERLADLGELLRLDELGRPALERVEIQRPDREAALRARLGVDEVGEIDRLVAEAYASDDLQEGLRAMSEKRPPNFTSH